MIFYFSATGNSEYVAQRLASALGDTLVPITASLTQTIPDNGEPVGFINPTYFGGLPTIVTEFLQRLTIQGDHYCYHILTCGSMTGNATRMLEKELGRKVDAAFAIILPDTWTPMFDISDTAKNEAILEKAEPAIDQAIEHIRLRHTGNYNHHRGILRLCSAISHYSYRHKTTAKFSVADSCTGCGLCEQNCPSAFITLKDNKPIWKEGHCNLCLACLHHCPQFAIQYGPRTQAHGQYHCPRTK